MLIGILGKKRSGKDTVASFIQAEYGFKRLAFADPIKKIVAAIDPYVDEFGTRLSSLQLSDDDIKKDYPEYRRLLQALGTEGLRDTINENFWIDILLKEAQRYENVVISDVRFVNEVKAIKMSGGYIWKVERTDSTEVEDDHRSEQEINSVQFDELIQNDGSLKDLFLTIHCCFKKY